jgi:hypothetical protein
MGPLLDLHAVTELLLTRYPARISLALLVLQKRTGTNEEKLADGD